MSQPPIRGGRGEAFRLLAEKLRSASLAETPEEPKPSTADSSVEVTRGGRGFSKRAYFVATEDEEPKAEKAQPVVTTLKSGRASLRSVSRPVPVPVLTSPEETEETVAVETKGQEGERAYMSCNYVRLSVETGRNVCQYHVTFRPDVDSVNYQRKIMRSFENVLGPVRVFQGLNLFLPKQLPDKVTTFDAELPSDGSPVTVEITYVKTLSMGHHECINLYNSLFRKIMLTLGFTQHGHNFYDPKGATTIPMHKLEVWPGYVTAVADYEGGVMLCCDSSFRVLRTNTAYNIMTDLQKMRGPSWKEEYTKLMCGQTVLTRYNNKTYTVDDIDFNKSPADKFVLSSGQPISYFEYYQQQYGLTLRNMDQPLLVTRIKTKLRGEAVFKTADLVPELCYLTGITDEMRADMKIMKSIAQCTRITPAQRQLGLRKFLHNVNADPEVASILGNWGLVLNDTPLNLTGRTLPAEDIFFANRMVHKGSHRADWTRLATSSGVVSPIPLKKWSVVFTRADYKLVQQFIDMASQVCPRFGIHLERPNFIEIPDDKTLNYVKSLQSLPGGSQMALVILTLQRLDKYAAIKKVCCVDSPIPSQVVLTRTIRNPDKLRTITQKVIMQINCKLGGTLWELKMPLKKVMVVGLDTYHDPTQRAGSVGAVVASINQPLTRWYSKIYVQKAGIELIDGLEFCFTSCILKYKEVNGEYPERIFIYRDGVGDGQLEACREYELPQLTAACLKISLKDNISYSPEVLFVVVRKRINTRIYAEGQGECSNPPPGSVVDHTVTRKNLYDFFLVSQNVGQGTVSPTHYVVIHNTSSMTPDRVQRLTFKLTHLYYNWSGTIRVPAPCMYAHKLAYLVGQCLHRENHESLNDKLFYL